MHNIIAAMEKTPMYIFREYSRYLYHHVQDSILHVCGDTNILNSQKMHVGGFSTAATICCTHTRDYNERKAGARKILRQISQTLRRSF